MTGYDIYKRVLNVSGYLNNGDVVIGEEALTKRITDLINQICLDLKIPEIKALEDNVTATLDKTDALCYGVCMLLALSDGDVEKNRLFSQIYNAKRTAVLSRKGVIADKLPTVDCGVG